MKQLVTLVVPLQFCCWLYANFQANNIINTVIINIPQSLQWNWGVFCFRLCIQHISQKVLWNHETCTERMLNLKSDINPLWKSSLTFLLIPLVGLVFVFLFVVADVDWTPSHEQSKTRVPPNLPQPLQCQQHSAVDSSQTQCLPRWVVYTTDTRVWMRKCCYVRSGTQSPEPEARDQYIRRHRFWRESWFLWRDKNWGTQRNTLGVRLRLTNLSPRANPGSNLGCSGGRCWWRPLHQPTCTVTPTSTQNSAIIVQ